MSVPRHKGESPTQSPLVDLIFRSRDERRFLLHLFQCGVDLELDAARVTYWSPSFANTGEVGS